MMLEADAVGGASHRQRMKTARAEPSSGAWTERLGQVAAARMSAMLGAEKEGAVMAARRGRHQPGFKIPFQRAPGPVPSS